LYGAGEKVDLDELYDSIFLMYCALLMLERVQFTGSFGVTFTIAATGLFQAIGKAVQKICQDELEIHAKADKEVLKIELKTARGQASYKRQLPKIKQLFEEVLQSEFTFIDYMFSEGRSLTGATAATMKQWVLFNARDVDKFLDLNSDYVFPTKNPCPHLEDWVNIGNVQAAPQEEVNNAYKVNTIVNDDSGKTFEVDF
jgi:ribonucleoside-diphosphate reductase beta chain